MHVDPYVHVYSVYICIYLNLLLAIASRMSYVHVMVVLCPVNNSVRYPDEIPRFVEYFSFLPLL